MASLAPSFFVRIFMAFAVFFRFIFDRDFAGGVQGLRRGLPSPPSSASTPESPAEVLHETSPESALQLLGVLQRDGRFVDFLQEDITHFSDADIGAAARVVHEGCQKVLHEQFTIEAIRSEDEGAKVTLEDGFDASAVRLVGNVTGHTPFTGILTHRGWRATKVRLPKLATSHDVNVLAAAEVEL